MRRFPDPEPPASDHRSAARYLIWLAGLYRGPLVLAAAYGISCTLAQGLIPAAVGRAIDTGLIADSRPALLTWGGVILALGVTQAITGTLRDRASMTNRWGAGYLTIQFTTRQATRLGGSLTRRTSAGEVVSIGAGDISRIGGGLESTARGSGAVVSIVVVAGIMLAQSWRLGLVVLVGVPVIAWTIARFMRLMHGRQRDLRDQQAVTTSLSVDIVEGLRVLRGIGGERIFADRYRDQSQRMRRLSVRVAVAQSWVTGVTVLLPGLLVTVIVWLGAGLVASGAISSGELVAFYGFAVFLAEQLRRITGMVDQLTGASVASRRVVDFLSLEPGPQAMADSGDASRVVADATLTDPEAGIVVAPGRFVGVVCEAWSEVGVLADRLAGRAGAPSSVTYGGLPLSNLPRQERCRRILLVDTESRLFSGPLREELDPYGRAGADEALLWRAVDDASARDIIDALPDGIDSTITAGGREFSGGQQQRLRLARALMADPDILVLVEPTNALDAHTEGRVAQRLITHRAGKATVAFTDSPILLDRADRVLFVHDGTVVASGTHGALLLDPRYRARVTREAAGV